MNGRVQKRLDMEQFHHFGTVFEVGMEDSETGKVVQKLLYTTKCNLTVV